MFPYWCEILAPKIREELKLREFENRMLRTIIGSKCDEVAEMRRKLHNQVLCDFCPSPLIIRVTKSRRMRSTWRVA
jgi:hypothetical protein